jgi:hypothetical protein
MLGGLGRMFCGGGADSMLRFQLEVVGDDALPKDKAETASSSWLNGKEE